MDVKSGEPLQYGLITRIVWSAWKKRGKGTKFICSELKVSFVVTLVMAGFGNRSLFFILDMTADYSCT